MLPSGAGSLVVVRPEAIRREPCRFRQGSLVVSREILLLQAKPTLVNDVAAHAQRLGQHGSALGARGVDELGGREITERQLVQPRIPNGGRDLRPLAREAKQD